MNNILDPYLAQKVNAYGFLRLLCFIMFILFIIMLWDAVSTLISMTIEDSYISAKDVKMMLKITAIIALMTLIFLIGLITIPTKESLVYRQITKLKMLDTPRAEREIERIEVFFDLEKDL